MKKFLLFLLTLVLGFSAQQLSAQQIVEILGDAGTTTNSYLPIYTLYNNTLSEQIYTADEVGMAGTITSIAFYNGGDTKSPNIKIYMVNTDKTAFSSNTDWLTVTDEDLVYDGTSVTLTEGDWTTITFDTPFSYDGVSNLGLIVDGNLQWSGGLACRVFSSTSNCAMYVYSDPTDYNAVGATYSASSRLSVKNQIKLEITPGEISCHATGTPVVSEITTTNATITWGMPEDASTYLVQYKTISQSWTDDDVVTDYASDTVYYFSDMLTPNTFYDFRVANMCSNGDTSIWRKTSFHTACDAIPLIVEGDPWTEDFEGYTGSGEQDFVCWDTPITDGTYRGPFVYCGYGDACHSGQNSAELKGSSNMLVLPEFTNDIHELRLSFWATKTSYAYGTVDVGVIEDITDPTTFEVLCSAGTAGPRGSSNAGNGNYMGPFDFNNVQAASGRIALRYNNASSPSESWNLDDFTVSVIPDCSAPMATSVTASDVVAQSATISWTDNDENHSAWVVYYKGNTDSDWLMESASSTSVELVDLNPETTYQVYVVSVCGGTEGVDATPIITFTTIATCYPPTNTEISQIASTSAMVSWDEAIFGANDYTVAYSEAGEDDWNELIASGTSQMLSGLQPSTEYDVMVYSNCELGTADTIELNFSTLCMAGGDPFTVGDISTYSIPVNNYYRYTYSQQIFLASEMGGATTIDSIAFDYDGSTASTAKTNVVIYLGHTSQATFASASNYIPVSDLQEVYSGHLNCQQGWNTFVFTTPFQYNGSDNLVLVVDDNSNDYNSSSYTFRAHNAGANRTLHFYSDSYNFNPSNPTSTSASGYTISTRSDVKFFIPCDNTVTCVAPNLYVTDVAEESITVDWAPGYQETAWVLEYRSASETEWTDAGSVTAPYELTGLNSNTIYYIRVQADCSGEYSTWSNTVSARTECSAITALPFTENFDTYGTGTNAYPICWHKLNTSSSDRPSISSTSYEGAGSLYFYTGDNNTYNIAISTEFDASIDISTLQATFMYRAMYEGNRLLVGVMSDPTDASTFTVVDTVFPDAILSDWVERDVVFSEYTGDGHYIAFKNEYNINNAYAYVDNLIINTASPCQKPSLLTISDITSTEATLSWTANGDEDSWNIAYGPVGFDPTDEEDEDVTIVPASTNPFTLTGLETLTAYDVYIQANCGYGELSAWTLIPVRLETAGCDTTEQCTYTFIAGDGYGDGWNGASIAVVQNGITVATVAAINHSLTSTQTYDTIPVSLCDNYPTQLIWHSGSFDSEISFMLIGSDGSEMLSIEDATDYSTGDTIENFLTNCSGCVTPSDLTYTLSEDATSVTLEWTAGGDEDSWILEYQANGDEEWTSANISGTPTFTIDDLTAATIYTIRVQADCGYGMSGYRTIHFNTPICNPTDQCEYTLNVTDSWGDGWNGAFLTVSQNGILVATNITVPSSSSQNSVTLALCGDLPVELTWHSGSYDSECSFELLGPDGVVVASQSSMSGFYTNDVVDTFTANCRGCMAPTNLAYTLSDDVSSATITWTAVGEADSWILEYQLNDGIWNVEPITGAPTYTIDNLSANTTYTVRVKSECADGMSGYKIISFLTPCAVAELAPYTENFASFSAGISPCWSRYSGIASDVFAGGELTSTTSGWNFSSNDVFPTGHPRLNIYGTGVKYWLVSPAIDLSPLTDPALTFDLALTDYNNADPIEDSTAQADDQFMVIISTDNGATWSAANATVWNNTGTGNYVYNSISTTGENITISLSQYAGQTITIAFYGESTTSGGDNDLHIANMVVDENGSTPTDPTVSTGNATAIAQTTATLNGSITNPSGMSITAKGFEWKLTTGGTYTQISGTGAGNTFTADLTGLTANTNYTFKAFITFNGTTVYGNEMTFTTLEEGQQTCDVPTNLTANATAYNAANVTWTAGGTETAWNLRYKSGTNNWTTVSATATSYQLTGLTAQTTYQVQVQAVCSSTSSSDWTASVSFTTPAEPVDPCDAPTNLQVSNITHNSATVSWTAGGTETSWSVQYKSADASQWQETTVQTTTFTMNGLTPQTAYDVRVKAICAPGNESDFISGEFTTNPDAIDNITLANSISLMPNPADNYIDLRINNNVNVKEAVVYNAFGQMVQTVELNDNYARIDLSNMAAGMYFVRVNGDNMTATKKFIRK